MTKSMHIVVIGGGPIGCYTAYLLASSGHNVEIYEEHSQIGTPIQCTGLLTEDFDQFNLPKDSFLINTLQNIVINSSQKQLIIPKTEYLVCRKKFDNYMANLALKAGAKIFLRHSFITRDLDKVIISDSLNQQKKELSPDLVIAADGPLSKVAKSYNFYHPTRKMYHGMQALVRGNFNKNEYHTFFGKDVCDDLFAWIVPESDNVARVGLASLNNAKSKFDRFLKQQNVQAVEIQSGMIPLYHPQQKLKKDNCYLVGDSSGFVKATTLGGIIPGMQQAEVLADCINNDKDYDTESKHLHRKMKLHLRLRNIFNKFSDKDWNRLLVMLKKDTLQKVLKQYSRDNPVPLVSKAIIKEPKLLYFLKHLF
jgi:digeranylgeranylglycerophospholipid reductase